MLNKKILYLLCVLGIVGSLIFIVYSHEDYKSLKKVEKNLKNAIYQNIIEYKKNLYEIEKRKQDNNL